jgi:hypothetical protein
MFRIPRYLEAFIILKGGHIEHIATATSFLVKLTIVVVVEAA